MLKEEQYYYKNHRPPFKVFDKSRSIAPRDMDTNIGPKMRELSAKSRKVFIQPLISTER